MLEVHESWRKRLCGTLSHKLLEVYCMQVKTCIEIALDCLVLERKDRPTIQDIVSRLNKTQIMIGDHVMLNEQFYQDDPGEQMITSKSSITSKPSSGNSEASRSNNSNNYLSAAEVIVYTFKDLQHMTDGFSEKRLIGRGTYGSIYKGVDNGKVIAVKKLYSQLDLDDDQFMNELWNLMRVQHQNILRLVGYCSETKDEFVEYEGKLLVSAVQHRALCLEYMQGGSLAEHISDEVSGLDWEARYKIIKGICQGLKYLHTGSKYPIYHLDLKPANILLDEDLIPKIGDFGLSRLLASNQTIITRSAMGTHGYVPPEYIERGEISQKFDVFSLGVIIIKVIAGRNAYFKITDMSSQEFIDLVTENWRKRVQPNAMKLSELVQVMKCLKIALRCVEAYRAKRPTITEIVEELNMIDFHLAALSC